MFPALPLVAKLKLAAAGLLALVAAAGLGGLAGYIHGLDVERGRNALAMQDAIVATFEATRADAAAESARRVRRAEDMAKAAAQASAAKREGQLDATRAARPDVALPDSSVRAINRAIAAANGVDAAPERMPDGLSAAAIPDRTR